MTSETWNVVLIIIVVLLAGYALYTRWKKGDTISAGELVATVENQIPFATELAEVAQIVVNEIEQAVREGVVLSNEEKFNRALDLVKKWNPQFAEIENRKIIAAIKSAVLVASSITNQINAAKTQVAEGERKGIDVE